MAVPLLTAFLPLADGPVAVASPIAAAQDAACPVAAAPLLGHHPIFIKSLGGYLEFWDGWIWIFEIDTYRFIVHKSLATVSHRSY